MGLPKLLQTSYILLFSISWRLIIKNTTPYPSFYFNIWTKYQTSIILPRMEPATELLIPHRKKVYLSSSQHSKSSTSSSSQNIISNFQYLVSPSSVSWIFGFSQSKYSQILTNFYSSLHITSLHIYFWVPVWIFLLLSSEISPETWITW